MKHTLARTLLLVTGLSSAVAQATDFTFRVPLRLTNIDPRMSTIVVDCYVSKDGYASAASLIGRNRVTVRIPSTGDLSTTVTVPVSADSGKDPRQAAYYGCYLKHAATGFDMNACSREGGSYFREECRLAPGAPFVPSVSGRIAP